MTTDTFDPILTGIITTLEPHGLADRATIAFLYCLSPEARTGWLRNFDRDYREGYSEREQALLDAADAIITHHNQ